MIRLLTVSIYVLLSTLVHATPGNIRAELNPIYEAFNHGAFDEAIAKSDLLLETLKAEQPLPTDSLGLVYYWRGLSYNRKSDFEKAVVNFEKAIKYQFKANDLIFEYGKALHGVGRLKESKAAFEQSYGQKYKSAMALYYLGFLSQQLGEEENVKIYDDKIAHLKIEEQKTAAVEVKKAIQKVEKTLPPSPVVNIEEELAEVMEAFQTGLYARSIRRLEELSTKIEKIKPFPADKMGVLSYWKGLSHNRLMDYANAVPAFEKAISLDFKSSDLQYEYAQALYGSEKISEARTAFQESFNQKYKAGVSLYYMGFLSQELGQLEDAKKYYQQIAMLDEVEKNEVEQASLMQVGDILLEQIEKQPDAIKKVQTEVIPQYKKAYSLDKKSSLAQQIDTKIKNLEEKYELVLYKMRNNRPTQVPPYFARASMDSAFDDNVVYSADETNLAQSKKASPLTKTDVMGRYSFYYKNIISIAPEIRTNRTQYWNRTSSIKANDNYAIVPAIRTAYEHTLWGRAASHLFDFDYNYAHRDLNADDKLEFSSRTQTYMLGERFNYLTNGETVFRLRRRHFNSFNESSNSITSSFVMEQILALKSGHMFILIGSYDQARNETKAFSTNALMARTDVIFPRYKDLFTPTLGLGVTITDPINNPDRGLEKMINPSVKLTRTLTPRLRATLRFEYWKSTSNVKTFQYTKKASGLELEYVF
jgi:tetratricopeptide (TPR) repeat protein